MLSVTNAVRAITANFSCSSRQTDRNRLVGSEETEQEYSLTHLNQTKLRQAFAELLSGCSIFRSQLWRDKVEKSQTKDTWKSSPVSGFLPISFFIIPDALLPMENLPEFRMFMAICPISRKKSAKTINTFKDETRHV